MTTPTSELTPPVQARQGSEPACPWRPSGDEPQPCHFAVAKDRSCVGGEAWGLTFFLPAQQRARVTMWVYAAEEVPGSGIFTVAYRCRQEHGPWAAAGWHAAPGSFVIPQDAIDAALGAAVALACGSFGDFPGGTPACLLWDGVPW